jgi:uncharacterized membrane protein YfcA
VHTPPVSAEVQWILLALAGFLSSALNMVAGGGSFLTLPLLIFFGLPAGEANGTNRVGVLAQNIGGVVGFHRYGVMDWPFARRVMWPCIVGSFLGVWAVLRVGDLEFRRVLSIVMILMSLIALVDPRRFRPRGHGGAVLSFVGFLAVGFYGGFLQAGVGFLILAMTSLLGLDLVRGNAVKVFLALVQVGASLVVFVWAGKVAWGPGFALAVGSALGSVLGVHLTVLKGHAWVQRVVTVTVVLFALKLWWGE